MMEVFYSPEFKRKYRKLTKIVKNKFRKQVKFLVHDLRHPSLRAKKYDESRDIWQARVDDNFRFYFLIKDNTYFFADIKSHPK